jgi:hypothetical protein
MMLPSQQPNEKYWKNRSVAATLCSFARALFRVAQASASADACAAKPSSKTF